MHDKKRRKREPESRNSKVMLVLSENEPEQKTSPEGQSNPSFGNFYTRLRRNDNDCRDHQQGNDRDSNQLRSLQHESDEAPTLAIVGNRSIHLTPRETLQRSGLLRNQSDYTLPQPNALTLNCAKLEKKLKL